MPLCPAPNACLMYLIRHGATDANLANPPRLQGRATDMPLSSQGRRQAEATAQLLATRQLSAVYCSPLRRATETAIEIAGRYDLEARTIDALTEIDVGAWEQQTWQDVERDEPDAYRRFMSNPAEHGYRDGENLTQVHERVAPAIRTTMEAHLGEAIACVAHNVVNRVFLAELIGLRISQARKINQDNCGVSVLRLRDGEIKLLACNSTFHLEASI